MTASSDAINVVCVKWGDWCAPRTAEYVNNLARAVRTHLTLPHRFICFTDDPRGLDEGIEVRSLPANLQGGYWTKFYPYRKLSFLRPLTSLPYLLIRSKDKRKGIEKERNLTRYPIDLRGWYNKLYLFKPGVLSGTCLFIDLDTVILGNVDELAAYPGPFCILRDFHRSLMYGSGLMIFQANAVGNIWERFVREGCPIMSRGDQAFIQECMPDADFFQDLWPGQVVSYKVHCQKRGVPPYARIVCFHGIPRPHEVQDPLLTRAWTGAA
jgi:hypothetical protein